MHSSFAQLLSVLHKENAPYALSVANKLYGDQSYQFLEVCFFPHFRMTPQEYVQFCLQIVRLNSMRGSRQANKQMKQLLSKFMALLILIPQTK